MKILIEVEVFGGYEEEYESDTNILIKHMTGRLQGVKAKVIKNHGDIGLVSCIQKKPKRKWRGIFGHDHSTTGEDYR